MWAPSSYSTHKLDFYYAATTSNPSWTYLTTLTPAGSGPQTLSANYVLPPYAGVQAVRAVFRSGGSASPCSTTGSAYDDRDDLALGARISGQVALVATASDNP